jgi:hypothetical protein
MARHTLDALVLAACGTIAPLTTTTTTKTTSPVADLQALRKYMLALPADNQNKKEIDLVLAGKSFAEPGERDTVMQRVCSTIAWCEPARKMRPEDVAELFRDSLTVWVNEPDADKTIDEELDKVVDKIDRAQEDWREYEKSRAVKLEKLRAVLRTDNTEPSFIEQHAILMFMKNYYVFDFGNQDSPRPVGYGLRAHTQNEVLTAARDAWYKAPLDLDYINDKGAIKDKTFLRVQKEYATVVHRVTGSMVLQQSEFDPNTRTFIEAVVPRREIKPKRHDMVSRWLHLLGGEHPELLLDWLSCLPRLDRPNSALYLKGETGAGKSLLALGGSRIWTEGGWTRLLNVIDKEFNTDLFRCPVAVLDEGIPNRKLNLSIELREKIAATQFTHNEKFKSPISVDGSARFMITANNDRVLHFGDEDMEKSDLEAMIKRVLYIKAHPDTAAWLEENNRNNEMTTAWIQGDQLAEHIVWLYENHTLSRPPGRFLVDGIETEMHRTLIMQGERENQIVEWVVRYLLYPDILHKYCSSQSIPVFMLVGNGKAYINSSQVSDLWHVYMRGHKRVPTTTATGRAISKVSHRRTRLKALDGDYVNMYELDVDWVADWADRHQLGDPATIFATVRKQFAHVAGEKVH